MFDDTPLLDVVGQQHPLRRDVVRPEILCGATVAEIVGAMDLNTERFGLPLVRLIRGTEMSIVPLDMWRKVRPKAGTRVEVAFPVRDPGSLALLASAALPHAASWAAGALSLTGGAYALAVGAITVVGALAINSLIPPAQQGGAGGPQNYAITGTANAANPYGVYPSVLGRHRMYPTLTASGYSETVGKDIYYRLRATFGWCGGVGGSAGVMLEDLRIGSTPIWEYEGVEIEMLNVDRERTLAAMPELADLIPTLTEEAHTPRARLQDVGDSYVFEPADAVSRARISVDVTCGDNGGSFDLALDVSEDGGAWVQVQTWPGQTGAFEWASADFGADGVSRRWRLRITGAVPAPPSEAQLLYGLRGTRPDFVMVTDTSGAYQQPQPGWRQGSETMRLYPSNVAEDSYNDLPDRDAPVVRYTREQTVSASVDISFTSGLYDSNDGDVGKHEASFRFSYQPVAGGVDEGAWITAGQKTYRAKSTTLLRYSYDITFPEPGEYAIRVERLDGIDNDSGDQNAGYLTAIRSFRDGKLPSHEGIAEIALRIKANDQLNGRIDSLNAIVQQLAPELDGNLQWTEPRPVRHPAWIYAQALRGPHLRRPVADERIDLATLYAWAAEEPHWTCDYVVDTATQLKDVLDIICAAGRARRTLADMHYSVVREGAAGPVRQVFTPRNSWDYRSKLTFPREIHGFRCMVRSERLDWQEDEVLVLKDGYTRQTATELETLQLPGTVVTAEDEDEGNTYRLGRYHLATALHRPETHSFKADWESIHIQHGEKIRLVHDVPLIGVGEARVKALTNENGLITSITLDDVFDFDQASFRMVVRNARAGIRAFAVASPVDPQARVWTPSVEVLEEWIDVGDLVAIEETEQRSADMLVMAVRPEADETALIEVVDAAPWVLDAATTEVPAYDPVITLPRPATSDLPPAPVITAAYSSDRTQLVLPDLSVRPRIAVQLAPIASRADLDGVTVQLRWREADEDETPWTYGETVPAGEYSLLTGALDEGVSYSVEARTTGRDGKTRGWGAAPADVTATTAAPAPPAIVASAVPASIADASGTARRPAIRLSWVAPTNRTVRVTWQLRVAATGEVFDRGRFAEASETPITLSDVLLPDVAYEIRASFVTGAPDLRRWSGWLPVTTPDLRLTADDVADELRERINTAFERHDEPIEDATGTVGDLRDAVLESFGTFGTFDGLPLAEAIERSIGSLTAPVPLSTRLDVETQRLTDTLPRIRSVEQTGRDLMQRMMALMDLQWSTDQRLTGAGIYVDPEDGTVKIEAFEYLQDQVSEVRVNLDAATAQLGLYATQAYVDQEVFRALTDPTQLPFLDDLIVDVREVELVLDGVNGTLEQHASALTVNGGLVTMTTVTSTLDAMAGLIEDRVTKEEFDPYTARLSAAEQVIEAIPDAATIRQSVEASRIIARDVNDLTARSIADMWGRYEAEEAIRVAEAQARSELQAYVDEQDRAVAEDVTELRGAVDTSNAQIRDELRVRAAEDEALGQTLTQVSAGLASVSGQAEGTADAVTELTGRVARNEEGLTAEAASRTLIVSSVRELQGEQRASTARSIVDMWNAFTAEENVRDAVAVSLEEVRTWVEEGLLAEANARDLLGAALGEAQASIVSERTARTSADEALARQANQLSADLGEAQAVINEEQTTRATADEALAEEISRIEASLGTAQGQITEINRVNVNSGSALVQSHLNIQGTVNDPETGLAAAHGGIEALNTVDVSSDSALVQDYLGLKGVVNDPETGLQAAHGEIDQINTVNVNSDSALVQAFLMVRGAVNDPETGLAAAHGEINELNTVDLSSDSALVQAFLTVRGAVNDPNTGLAAAHGEIDQINTVDVSSDSTLVQAHLGLQATVNHPSTGLAAAHGEIDQINTVSASSSSVIAQTVAQMSATLYDADSGLAATATSLDGVTTQVEEQGDSLTALAGRANVIEASLGAGQLVPNGDFLTDRLDGWSDVDTGFAVIPRGTTAFAAVQNAPTPFVLRSAANDYSGAVIVDGVPVQPGQQFRVSFRSAAASGGNALQGFRFIFFDAAGNVLSGADQVREAQSNATAWTDHDDLDLVTVPPWAASARIRFRRSVGGVGWGFATSLRVERVSATETDVRARVETVEATRVDADGAVAAVERQISASYGDLTAMASATAFAQAGLNGINSGFIFQLNGENVLEAVSVSDGVGGPVSTFRLAADYVQITGIAQIDTAVISQLFADEIVVGNLTVTGEIIAPGAVSSQAHVFAWPYASTADADFILVSSADYTTLITLDPMDVEAGSSVRLDASCNIDAPDGQAWGLVAYEMQYRANEQAPWSAWEGIRFSATGIIPGKAADGQMIPFTHATADLRSATEQRRYRLRARLQPGSPRMRICRVDFFAQQIKR
ncbi:hypothetical protein GCM10011415_27990 [Salipiger pallidus]|uniref:Tip attachment protein J HDII-ins2 domain-containing protein n=1 Tax=Salipiger pallidus TaxID=1775170 RepID=A0A8J2ZLB5_9RHOB|nr:host specificity factor TipJ family phage tail protein [Salipiger pallidus]GGG77489.1 hypothetical protein GCM10011415_27990 [Salipiger pallidus]